MGTANDDIWGSTPKAVKRPLPRERSRPLPPGRKARGVCPRCGAGGAIDEVCRQASCQGAIFAKKKDERPRESEDSDRTVMVSAYRERRSGVTDDSDKTVVVSAYRARTVYPAAPEATVMLSAMEEPAERERAVMMPITRLASPDQDTVVEKTAFIAPLALQRAKNEAPRSRQARRPRPRSQRAQPSEPERLALVSDHDKTTVATSASDVKTRKAPEHRRPAVVRKSKPIAPDRRPPTMMRPAFVVDPADLERAASQETLVPDAFDATIAAAASAQPVHASDMQIVSATSNRSDWVDGASQRTLDVSEASPVPSGVAKHPAQRRRPVWLAPLLAAVGAAALVGTFSIALSGDSTADSPLVMVTPGPPIIVPGVIEAAAPMDDGPAIATAPAHEAQGEQVAAVEPEPDPTPKWVQANASINPWVDVAGAPADTALGLSPDRQGSARGRLTGFPPGSEHFAPTYDYSIQSREVTWLELGRLIFAEQRAAPDVPGWSPDEFEVRATMPATNVPWELANDYCQALGGALPSEAEWAWAARGPELRTHPWGEELPYADRVRLRRGAPVVLAPVATMSQDVTPGETPLHDMLGNAAEWTRDRWVPSDATEEPTLADGDYRAVRGWPLGDPGDPLPAEGLTYRRAECARGDCLKTANLELIGFRCMKR